MSSGRYQSRLFNFLSQQSRKLLDKSDRALRQLKVAATWGAQILLYPVYLAFQSTRLVGRQLQQAVRQGLPRLKAAITQQPEVGMPAADAPLQNLLQGLPSLALLPDRTEEVPEASVPSSSLTPADASLAQASSAKTIPGRAIQGIASSLISRTLVLVTSDNELWDVLTPEQQRQLYQRMIWELALYYRQVQRYRQVQGWGTKQLALRSPFTVARKLPPPIERPTMFLPIRVVRRLMTWMQTGPVAIAVNLFQEAAWVEQQPPMDWRSVWVGLEPIGWQSLSPEQVLALLDRSAADLEVRGWASVADMTGTLVHQGQGWLQQMQTQIQTITVRGEAIRSADAQMPQSQRGRIVALIQAAIDYFFHRRTRQLSQQPSQQTPELPSQLGVALSLQASQGELSQLSGTSSDVSLPATSETWLTLEELFGPSAPTPGNGIAASIQLGGDYPRLAKALGIDSLHPTTPPAPQTPPPIAQPRSLPSRSITHGFALRRLLTPLILPLRWLKPVRSPVASSFTVGPDVSQEVADLFSGKVVVPPTTTAASAGAIATPVPTNRLALTPQVSTLTIGESVTSVIGFSEKRNVARSTPVSEQVAMIKREQADVVGGQKPEAVHPQALLQFTQSTAITSTPVTVSSNNPVKSVTDWVEAKATPVGYVKHPLEQVLEWLDQVMLWCENAFIFLWRSLQARLKRSADDSNSRRPDK